MTATALLAEESGRLLVHYLPIGTTALSAAFVLALLWRASAKKWSPHLVWWAVGIFFYGVGTALESTITLRGNTETLNRLWYWAGAMLGGYPLGTGSLYLLAKRRTAHWLTAISAAFVIVASVALFLAPIDLAALESARPSGKAIGWHWVRLMTPFINLYAVIFLVGGALYSTGYFLWVRRNGRRAAGTGLIALGALLPGIGGAMTKGDMLGGRDVVEALYIGEFVGLILIILGYYFCISSPKPVLRPTEPTPHAES